MDGSIFSILMLDAITSGAVYALLALALVIVFSVTRVIYIPQGEWVAFGALTLAAIQTGAFPQTATLLLALALCAFVQQAWSSVRAGAANLPAVLAVAFAKFIFFPIIVFAVAKWTAPNTWPMLAQIGLTLAIVAPMGPIIYRLAFQPLAQTSTLLLLIVAVAVHFAFTGLGLVMFGAEGSRTTAFSDTVFEFGAVTISAQSLVIIGVALTLILALYLYFGRTLSGKALRATAVNRRGAQLVGIGTQEAGRRAFALASTLGALCGVLIAPLTTVYYDSGFLIGLKGFVGAIFGGLGSYPVAAAGAVLVGLLESFSSYWASAFKEVIVFTLIIPVLLWRSLTTATPDDDGEH